METANSDYTNEEKLSNVFCMLLSLAIGDEALKKVIEKNKREKNPDICHSHDYCDANMVMIAAFIKVFGREPDLNADSALINSAWNQSKAHNFNF